MVILLVKELACDSSAVVEWICFFFCLHGVLNSVIVYSILQSLLLECENKMKGYLSGAGRWLEIMRKDIFA